MPHAAVSAAVLGWLARDRLAKTRGRARVVAALTRSAYLEAGDALIWIGAAGEPLHGRAVLVTDAIPPLVAGDAVTIGLDAPVWTPDDGMSVAATATAGAARSLLGQLHEVATPAGFATILTGAPLEFPFNGAVPAARAVAQASHDDEPDAAVRAAADLIGWGPGLTPAGDDYVGGVFFARALLDSAASRQRWRVAGEAVVALARRATHPISAVLLADLVAGHGHAPLHDVLRALADGALGDGALADSARSPVVIDAARRLTRIGHSSGWDILAGVIGALVPPACWHHDCMPSSHQRWP